MGKKRGGCLPAMLLAGAVLLAGCGAADPVSLTADLKPAQGMALSGEEQTDAKGAVMDFSVRLLQSSQGEGNLLLSPVSVLCALGMAESGAKGETLAQMEEVFGVDEEAMNAFLGSYVRGLPSGDNYRLHIADSIWLNALMELQIEEDFLQANADNYDAQIYELGFDDAAKEQINAWVKENTDGMIPTILDQMDPAAAACLMNAVAFDAKWADPYEEAQVGTAAFTTEDGTGRQTEVMYGEEYHYLEGDNETGFAKYYEGDGEADTYAFIALLPEEGLSMQEYLMSLTGEELSTLLENERSEAVVTMLPKFTVEYGETLNGALATMGMEDAFDAETADFSGMGTASDGNIYIDRVLHKTYMAVDEAGTRAGAVTAVVMEAAGAEPSKTVYLDRPFVYLIVDCENHLPLFFGVMRDPAGAAASSGETEDGGTDPTVDGTVGNEETGGAECNKRMVMLDGKLYVETGETDSAPRCGMMDGAITSTTGGAVPTEDGQSNFGKDIGWQYGGRDNRIEIYLDDEWRVFAYNENNIDMAIWMEDETATGGTVVFENGTERELQFGEDFSLEMWDAEYKCWTNVPIVVEGNWGFTLPAYPVAAGASREWAVDWEWLYGRLSPGAYRIVKTVQEVRAGDYTEYTLTAEFKLAE